MAVDKLLRVFDKYRDKREIGRIYLFLKTYVGKVDEDMILAFILHDVYLALRRLSTCKPPMKTEHADAALRSQIPIMREFIKKVLEEIEVLVDLEKGFEELKKALEEWINSVKNR